MSTSNQKRNLFQQLYSKRKADLEIKFKYNEKFNDLLSIYSTDDK